MGRWRKLFPARSNRKRERRRDLRPSLFITACLLCGFFVSVTHARDKKEGIPDCQLSFKKGGTVIGFGAFGTLILDDGAEVRLLAILPPGATKINRHQGVWPIAGKAQKTIEKMLLGQRVELGFDKKKRDRYGRLLAHVYILEGKKRIWLQHDLIARGLARVSSFAAHRACVEHLLQAEEKARKGGREIWASGGHEVYAVRTADNSRQLLDYLHSFQIVEGTVRKVSVRRRYIFLNFGENWRYDFTVPIEKKTARLFATKKINLNALEGQKIRIRGWIERWNGPAIKLTHPEQLEILTPLASTGVQGEDPSLDD